MKLTVFTNALFLSLLLLFTSSCASISGPPRTGVNASKLPDVPLKEASVSKYVNDTAKKLVAFETPGKIGTNSVSVFVLETSRIQSNSSFHSPRIEITRGMLNVMQNEAELASVLGHEIGHKVLHSKNSTFVSKNYSTREIDYADWSKEREKEADEYGAILAQKAGYDPYALLDFFDRLSHFQKGDIIAWFGETTATHKDFRNRSKDLKKFLERTKLRHGQGILKANGYTAALSNLKTVSTGDAICEILPGGPKALIAEIGKLEDEVKTYEHDKTPIPAERFLQITGELSESTSERVLSAAGLLAGSRSAWRAFADGLDRTLNDLKLAKKLSTETRMGAHLALDRAEEIGDRQKSLDIIGHVHPHPGLCNPL